MCETCYKDVPENRFEDPLKTQTHGKRSFNTRNIPGDGTLVKLRLKTKFRK